MAYNQTVNIDVNANTQDAEAQIGRLENNIKTLDGAINLVGGSIEVLAGSLALTGAVTEEQAERFEAAAVGAIALADGAKRMMDGFKSLAESTKILTVVQRIYNTVLKANPIFIIVGVIAAVTTGVIALTKALKSQREEQERLNRLEADQTYIRLQERSLKIAQLRGESALQLAERERDIAKRQNEVAQANYLAAKGKEEEEEAQKEYNATWDAYLIAQEKVRIETKKANEEAALQAQMLKDRNEGIVELQAKEVNFQVELRDEYKLTANTQLQTEKAKTAVAEEEAKRRIEIRNAEAEYEEMLYTQGIDNIQGALAALFGESKAVASANVLVDAAQAAVGIINNSQKTGPFAAAYQATQFALLAATTFASLRQINSAQPGVSGAPNIPRGGAGTPQFGVGQTVSTTGTLTPSLSGTPPVRAYVLSGEVSSALEADSLLNTRRQFP